MAYLVDDIYLFSGDIAILDSDGKISPIPSIFDMDNPQAIKSMDVIRQIPTAEYIFTAHWGYSTDYKKAVSPR